MIQFNAKVKSLTGFSTDRMKTAYAIEIAEGAGETHFYEAMKYALKELRRRKGHDEKRSWCSPMASTRTLRKVDRSTVSTAQTDEEALGRSSLSRVAT